jgi:hypothetical protein
MFQYIVRRIIGAFFVLFIVSVLTFLIFQITPTLLHLDLAYFYVGRTPPSPEGLKAINHDLASTFPYGSNTGTGFAACCSGAPLLMAAVRRLFIARRLAWGIRSASTCP